jgi:YYY domain-containing protein
MAIPSETLPSNQSKVTAPVAAEAGTPPLTAQQWPSESLERSVNRPADLSNWITTVALVAIILVGAYFRFTGLGWDDNQHLHPDERFMTSVADGIRLVGLADYFDTDKSTMSPFSYGSYTYGMLPLFLTRIVGEAVKQADYDHIVLVGRALSGIFDLAAVLGLFFLGARFYNRRVGLLATALYGACVLPIQLSHYFTVDSFATVFIIAAFFVAEPVMQRGRRWHYAVFGLLTGLAMACKINTAPVAGVIVVAGLVRLAKGYYAKENRRALLNEVLVGWLIAGGLAALCFRIFQPYAFTGPTIFGIGLNQHWLDIMKEVTSQVAGNADYPPNTHWTDRSQLTYAWIQTAGWGMGLPLGIAATLGWIWAAFRSYKTAVLNGTSSKIWQNHLLLVLWVGGYFVWQNAQFWRYMRYFMPIYPFAVLLGAWALIELYDRVISRSAQTIRQLRQARLLRGAAIGSLVVVLLSTYGYAFAFIHIYTQPHTRVTASDWMLANIPGPLNIHIDTPQGPANQPLEVPYELILKPGEPWHRSFQATASGTLSSITSYQLAAPDTTISIKLTHQENGDEVITEGRATIPAPTPGLTMTVPVLVPGRGFSGGQTYYVQYTVRGSGAVTASALSLVNDSQTILTLDPSITTTNTDEVSGTIAFTPEKDITVDRLMIGSFQVTYPAPTSTVKLTIARDEAGEDKLIDSQVDVNPAGGSAPIAYNFSPVNVEKGQSLFVTMELLGGTPIQPAGSTLAMETSWDDSMPLRVNGYDPLGGIYRTTNLELFEPDSAFKRDRLVDALNRSDYLVVSSNRSYDAMPRLPLRYPLTLAYYQALFACNQQFIIYCAYPAQTGFKSPLGYELVATFESDPTIGPFSFSDQWAEEAFTVYDHPKVMLFKKTSDYSSATVSQVVNKVDLTQVLEQDPAAYSAMPTGMVLPPDRLADQTQGGTWSDLFDRASLLNQNEFVGVLVWYILLLVIGWVTWPLVFSSFRGLPDHGYPLAKLLGLLFITWIAWFSASYKVLPFTQPSLWFLGVVLVGLSLWFTARNRKALREFTSNNWRYLALVEGITLGLFLYFLSVRWLNPDLWHPWLGGEKPADFSFFQSAVRSVYFPAYDPWLSGHYVNYYYYGYVVAAVPTKLLGIVPAFAYNLVLPTLFALAGIGAFCVAFNLSVLVKQASPAPAPSETTDNNTQPRLISFKWSTTAGLTAAIMMMLLGNLYQIRQFWQYLPEIADPPSTYSDNLAEQTENVLSGGWRLITGQAGLPGDKGRWYFGASRAILHDKTDTPITEFPYFSFLYADLHPHLTSMSMILAALGWLISLVFAAASGVPLMFSDAAESPLWRRLLNPEVIMTWFTGGVIIGALQPTHTWDFPPLLALGMATIITALWLHYRKLSRQLFLQIAFYTVGFAALCILLYYPFRQWFATEYSSISIWDGIRTPLIDYLNVHGLFLFVIVTALFWESRSWFKTIPVHYLLHTTLGELLPKIKNRLLVGFGAVLGFVVVTFALWANDYQSLWFAMLLVIWALALIFQPNQTLPRRVWLMLVLSGLGLTAMVELITLKGDIGRSNTVFKYYIEAWVFFSVTAGVALAWLLPIIWREWSTRPRRIWLGSLGILVAAAATYTVTATYAKVTDRWPDVTTPPYTLDGNAYMLGSVATGANPEHQPAFYDDEGTKFNLADDYYAIQWLQDNIKGTPIIVEGNSPLYRWGTRIAVNTGLPTVMGWDNHIKQHDSILPGPYIDSRVQDVAKFYNTNDNNEALSFLRRYSVQYIVVGALERKYYEEAGLAKFVNLADQGVLQKIYPLTDSQPTEGTLIYQVIKPAGN